MIEYYETHKEWEGWYTFGTMVPIHINVTQFDSFPTYEEWDRTITSDPNKTKPEEVPYVKSVVDHFYHGTKLYMEANNIVLPNYSFLNFSLAKYKTGGAMFYHTDFQQERAHIPESKFNTTCLFYLNDNYEGGEISFAIMDDTHQEIIDIIDYKPVAGDMVIFPSSLPIYHGVKPITEGEKYIIRTYWKTTLETSPEWEQGIEKYGEEQWRKIQEQKAKDIRGSFIKVYNGENITLQGLKENTGG